MKIALLNRGRLSYEGDVSFKPITEGINNNIQVIQYESTTSQQIVNRVQGCEILISKELQLDRETIKDLPSEVRLICEAGTGYNNIDIKAANEKGIRVCNVPGYSTSHVAQITTYFILGLSSGMFLKKQGKSPNLIHEVKGKFLGVIGAGDIGKQVIKNAYSLGIKVLVYTRTPKPWKIKGIRNVSLKNLLAKSDFITLHCPLNDKTRHLIDAVAMHQMKAGVFLINTARGGLINHDHLTAALQSGHIAGAALDVQDPEPLPIHHPLRLIDNVKITDHIGWQAVEARERLVQGVADNISAYLENGAPSNEVRA